MADAKKFVFKVDVHDEMEKSKAMKAVASFSGIDSIAVDIKDRKMTLIGIVDPVVVVVKLRKRWPHADILTVGPAKESEKKTGTDKPDDKDPTAEWIKYSQIYNPYTTMHYYVQRAEENPCVVNPFSWW